MAEQDEGNPTAEGEPEHDTAAELAETIAGIRRGLADVQAGRGQPAEEAFAEIRAEFGIPEEQGRIESRVSARPQE